MPIRPVDLLRYLVWVAIVILIGFVMLPTLAFRLAGEVGLLLGEWLADIAEAVKP